jgi:hypothetical protein
VQTIDHLQKMLFNKMLAGFCIRPPRVPSVVIAGIDHPLVTTLPRRCAFILASVLAFVMVGNLDVFPQVVLPETVDTPFP